MQVPKQGRNLHRESAFYVALVAQVPALKWNPRHLRLNLRRLSLNLRHRGASVHFRNSPADVRTKKQQSSTVSMYVHRARDVAVALMLPIISMLAQLTGTQTGPVSCVNQLIANYLSATKYRCRGRSELSIAMKLSKFLCCKSNLILLLL